jgi:hypothetical protein
VTVGAERGRSEVVGGVPERRLDLGIVEPHGAIDAAVADSTTSWRPAIRLAFENDMFVMPGRQRSTGSGGVHERSFRGQIHASDPTKETDRRRRPEAASGVRPGDDGGSYLRRRRAGSGRSTFST